MLLLDLKQKYSNQYTIAPISEENLDLVFPVLESNEYFYSRTQHHPVTKEELAADIYALPPNTSLSQKHFIAFFEKESADCFAVLDIVEGYPDAKTVYLGFFILKVSSQNKGLGASILRTLSVLAIQNGFTRIELGCYEENEIGYKFWLRMGFSVIRTSEREIDGKSYRLFSMEKQLDGS
jgi:ribosomal protein S18 acetylase RimI-like enzyme